ncbi:DUF6233 domain-containing protein [Streptomyces atriruber]|uniref:DUF6233 domain-containing protein n=1 Tax=Streptomyces atriruber TaxID=545121 RepID=UPI003CC60CAA
MAARRAGTPAPPYWVLDRGIGQGGPLIEVHRGGCHAAGSRRRTVTRDEARRALFVDQVRACTAAPMRSLKARIDANLPALYPPPGSL